MLNKNEVKTFSIHHKITKTLQLFQKYTVIYFKSKKNELYISLSSTPSAVLSKAVNFVQMYAYIWHLKKEVFVLVLKQL